MIKVPLLSSRGRLVERVAGQRSVELADKIIGVSDGYSPAEIVVAAAIIKYFIETKFRMKACDVNLRKLIEVRKQ